MPPPPGVNWKLKLGSEFSESKYLRLIRHRVATWSFSHWCLNHVCPSIKQTSNMCISVRKEFYLAPPNIPLILLFVEGTSLDFYEPQLSFLFSLPATIFQAIHTIPVKQQNPDWGFQNHSCRNSRHSHCLGDQWTKSWRRCHPFCPVPAAPGLSGTSRLIWDFWRMLYNCNFSWIFVAGDSYLHC